MKTEYEKAIDAQEPADRRVCVYDLTPASDVESALHKKLIEMGWKPPGPADEELRRDAERYRWVQRNGLLRIDGAPAWGWSLRFQDSVIVEGSLSDHIDAAIAAEKREGA